jgi:3D (Asp-Asp-Asp) domain-containing protein
VAAGITVIVVLAGALNAALAGEDPKSSVRVSSQTVSSQTASSQLEPLDVPGSFKARADAIDAVTAKRSAEQITLPSATRSGSAQLSIDAEKVPGSQNSRKLTGLRTPRLSVEAAKVTSAQNPRSLTGLRPSRVSVEAAKVTNTQNPRSLAGLRLPRVSVEAEKTTGSQNPRNLAGSRTSRVSVEAEKVTGSQNPRNLAGSRTPRVSVEAEKVTGSQNPRNLAGSRAPRISIDAENVDAKVNTNIETIDIEGDLIDFDATAYCLKGRTASGIDTRPGVIAADPRVLPMGTVVHLRAGRYTGTYTVMDTGSRIRGRRVDVYVTTHREAVAFGRRQVKLKVMSRGSAKAARANMNPVVSER